MNVILYTIHCPNCKVLELLLKKAGINYIEVTDIDVMKERGIKSVPVLSVDGKLMTFSEAKAWVNKRKTGDAN